MRSVYLGIPAPADLISSSLRTSVHVCIETCHLKDPESVCAFILERQEVCMSTSEANSSPFSLVQKRYHDDISNGRSSQAVRKMLMHQRPRLPLSIVGQEQKTSTHTRPANHQNLVHAAHRCCQHKRGVDSSSPTRTCSRPAGSPSTKWNKRV